MYHSKSTDYKPQWEGWLRQNQVSAALFLPTLPILRGLHSSENRKVEEEVWPQGGAPKGGMGGLCPLEEPDSGGSSVWPHHCLCVLVPLEKVA